MVTHQPELAIDADGQPIDVPPEVVAWRLRRVKGPGKPGLVHDPMGRPLSLPITATFQDLYDVAGPGKYIVDPIDELGRHCKDVPSGVTGVIQPQTAEDPEPAARSSIRNASIPGTNRDDLIDVLLARLVQTVEVNTRITELVVSRMPSMFDAASGLINAADGAKLPTRTPPPMPAEPPPSAYDEQAPTEATADESWFRHVLSDGAKAFATTIAEKLGASFSSIPLSALLDWSKAAPGKPPAPAPQVPPAAPRPSWAPPRWSAPPAWEPSPPPRASDPSWSAADSADSVMWDSAAPAHAAPAHAAPAPTARHSAPTLVTIPVVAERSIPVASFPVASAPLPAAPMPSSAMPSAAAAPDTAITGEPTPGVSVLPTVQVATAAKGPGLPDSAPREGRIPAAASTSPTTPAALKRRNDAGQLAPTRQRTSMDDSVPMSAHVMRVYESLTLQERTLVQQLLEQLTQEERMQWLMELASLSLPDAVARVRGVLRPLIAPPSGGPNGVSS